eukprot:3904809-Rhodomonas_salina.1
MRVDHARVPRALDQLGVFCQRHDHTLSAHARWSAALQFSVGRLADVRTELGADRNRDRRRGVERSVELAGQRQHRAAAERE